MSSDQGASAPVPSNPGEIDALRDAAAAGGQDGGQKLWRGLLGLAQWYIVDRANENEEPKPHGTVNGNQRMLAIFTDEARAQSHIVEHKVAETPGGKPVVRAITPENTIRMAYALTSQGLTGLNFNPGPKGFAVPLGFAIPVWADIKGIDIQAAARQFGADEFEVMAVHAMASRNPESLKKLLRHAWRLPYWYMLDNPQNPNSPLTAKVQENRVALMLFTSEMQAARAGIATKVAKPDGKVDLIRVGIPEGIKVMREAQAQGITLAIFNVASAGFPLDFSNLDWLASGKD